MKHLARFTVLYLTAVMVACAGDQTLGPDLKLQSALLSAGSSACYPVKADFTGTPTGAWTFSGVLTGDLEGTMTIDFDPASLTFAGATIQNRGTANWNITGGVLPAPLAFESTFENMNLAVDRPGSPALEFENIGTHHALNGVAKATLHYTGSFTVIPVLEANHRYQGVICP